MRVISGNFKGRVLKTLEGNDVRPTTDKVKEAIFSMIQFEIEGKNFLDLFSGSGQMGIEAVSRGASEAALVEQNRMAISIIKKNLNLLGNPKNINLFECSAEAFLLDNKKKFDIAFLDPPYKKGVLEQFIEKLSDHMAEDSTIICEHSADETLPTETFGFIKTKERKYGKISISILKRSKLDD